MNDILVRAKRINFHGAWNFAWAFPAALAIVMIDADIIKIISLFILAITLAALDFYVRTYHFMMKFIDGQWFVGNYGYIALFPGNVNWNRVDNAHVMMQEGSVLVNGVNLKIVKIKPII